jgi:hypothetical protein
MKQDNHSPMKQDSQSSMKQDDSSSLMPGVRLSVQAALAAG